MWLTSISLLIRKVTISEDGQLSHQKKFVRFLKIISWSCNQFLLLSIKSVRSKVTQWEQDLNTVSDAIELWMIVQRNWMYLEGIFASEDIRIQLPEEAKKFSKTDNNYKEIMKKT